MIAIHRLPRTPKTLAATQTVDRPTPFQPGQRRPASVSIVSEEGVFARLLLITSLFLQRATWFAVFVVSLCTSRTVALAADDVFSPPAAADVRTKVLRWVAERGVTDKAVLETIGREWVIEGTSLSAEEIFQRVIRTLTSGRRGSQKDR